MNVKLLRRIQKHILAEPRRYDQSIWGRFTTPVVAAEYDDMPPCGTTACIAGWAYVLGDKPDLVANGLWSGTVIRRGQSLLDLDNSQAGRLFASPRCADRDRWPEKYAKAYLAAKSPQGKVRVAVNRINHFIKTNGAE